MPNDIFLIAWKYFREYWFYTYTLLKPLRRWCFLMYKKLKSIHAKGFMGSPMTNREKKFRNGANLWKKFSIVNFDLVQKRGTRKFWKNSELFFGLEISFLPGQGRVSIMRFFMIFIQLTNNWRFSWIPENFSVGWSNSHAVFFKVLCLRPCFSRDIRVSVSQLLLKNKKKIIVR